MKIALITDTHWGIRNDNVHYLDNAKKFLDNVFFPSLKDQNITTIIHLGDLVDRRKFSNHYTISRLREDFLEPLRGYDIFWILGNHDLFYRNSLKVNAADLVKDYELTVIASPVDYVIDKTPILFLPWICSENRDECYEAIERSNSKILMGHLELEGFEMQKGIVSDHGDSTEPFRKFDMVFTGHYHHKQHRDNIHYLGASGEFTWADYGDPRGFHTFDTDTLRLDFIPNPYNMFQKVVYDDRDPKVGNTPSGGFQVVQGKNLKVIVKAQTNQEQFEWFISKIEEAKPLQIQIIRETLLPSVNTDIQIENKDTLSVILDVVKSTSDNPKLEMLIKELYLESQETE